MSKEEIISRADDNIQDIVAGARTTTEDGWRNDIYYKNNTWIPVHWTLDNFYRWFLNRSKAVAFSAFTWLFIAVVDFFVVTDVHRNFQPNSKDCLAKGHWQLSACLPACLTGCLPTSLIGYIPHFFYIATKANTQIKWIFFK